MRYCQVSTNTEHLNIDCVFILYLLVTSPSRLLRIVSTNFLALHLFCFNICQHSRQTLHFKLHVDGCKFHYRRPHGYALLLSIITFEPETPAGHTKHQKNRIVAQFPIKSWAKYCH